jgi:tRNA (mo5U34)-methyltransferase
VRVEPLFEKKALIMTATMNDVELQARIQAVRAWYHRIELRPGIITPGINDSATVLARLQWPEDWSGLRVLDVGTRDGFFAFEAERRGASEVVAVDYVPATQSGFSLAAEVLGSRARFVHANLYDLDPATLGTFDVVLFLGLLYHLPDPLGALRLLRRLTTSTLYLESVVKDFGPGTESIPLMEYFPADTFGGDPTNFWGPNARCIEALLTENQFRVVRAGTYDNRGIFVCDAIADDRASWKIQTAFGVIPKSA